MTRRYRLARPDNLNRLTVKSEPVGEYLEHAIAVDILTAFGVALEDIENNILFARPAQVLQSGLGAQGDKFINRFGFQVSQIHR